jgi:hypothetical protein
MKTTRMTILGVALLILTGCGGSSSLMVKSKPQTIPVPDNETVTIVFMRSSFVGSAVNVELFEIENNNLKFIGSLPNGTKIAHRTTPGSKTYMTFGAAADYMLTDNLTGGQTYYVIVRPNWGSGGFAPTPVRKDGPSDYTMKAKEFKQWTSNKLMQPKPQESEKWFQKVKAKYEKIHQQFWPVFQQKTADQKKERTMTSADGVKN